MFKPEEMKAPRIFPDAEKPGSYQLATQANESILNPGDTFSFEQYITGYGEISGAKIQCYFSPDAFDHQHSTVDHSINVRELGNGISEHYWGSLTTKIDPQGFAYSLKGLSTPHWETDTLFFDISTKMNGIATERKLGFKDEKKVLGKAPFEFNLKTNKKIKPGEHHIDFYFTYFNSWEWICTKERVTFKVNNRFERHATSLSILATIALLVTIFKDGIHPIFEKIF
ncbi:hypothetical protein NM213_04750 [Pseudomonas lactis]|uniref:hypothetical protein n=1 Tax=Pseudomonas lactis TaxID=1615674 RepID=UPI00054B8AE4|nr:hypothetical protein [Pseudomonas lactis]MDR8369220.1 hypothetical protein [Pseudomonas lactis]